MTKVEPTAADRARFQAACETFRLAWRCTDCVHYADRSGKCSLEYPTSELMAATSFDTLHGTYVFCKHFELI